MEYGKYKLNKIDWLEFKRYNLYLLNQKLTIKITVFWASIIILSLSVFTTGYCPGRQ